MKNKEQIGKRWDIIEMTGYQGQYRSLGEMYDSLEEATAEVRKLNKKACSQTSFFIRDLITEYDNISNLKRG